MEEPKFLNNTTLHQRQMRYYNGHFCVYCDGQCDYIDSIEVFQESYGWLYICRKCRAWCSTLPNSDQSIGYVGKKDLRNLRMEVHKFYDPLWQKKVSYGSSPKSAQTAARKWVSTLLHLPIEETHIAYLTPDNLNILLSECKKYYLTEEQKQEIQAFTQLNAHLASESLKDLGIQYKEFNLNGQHKFEIIHPATGKTFHYFPRINSGGYDLKKIKALDQEIEQYLAENFKLSTSKL